MIWQSNGDISDNFNWKKKLKKKLWELYFESINQPENVKFIIKKSSCIFFFISYAEVTVVAAVVGKLNPEMSVGEKNVTKFNYLLERVGWYSEFPASFAYGWVYVWPTTIH